MHFREEAAAASGRLAYGRSAGASNQSTSQVENADGSKLLRTLCPMLVIKQREEAVDKSSMRPRAAITWLSGLSALTAIPLGLAVVVLGLHQRTLTERLDGGAVANGVIVGYESGRLGWLPRVAFASSTGSRIVFTAASKARITSGGLI